MEITGYGYGLWRAWLIVRVQSLHIYPIKSTQGVDQTHAEIRPRGLTGDRRYMLIDDKGMFITQRQIPELAKLKVEISRAGLALHWPNSPSLSVQITDFTARKQVTVWRSELEAAIAKSAINETISKWLGTSVSLVHMDKDSARISNPEWTDEPAPVSFADGYPILVTNTASLRALNALIMSGGGEEVSMTRFRPNIVIDSDEPWGEDDWGSLQIGGVILDLVKPCARCIMSTLDQKTGEKQGREPLRSLKSLRTSNDPRNPGVLFGMNAVPRVCGSIAVSDKVERRCK